MVVLAYGLLNSGLYSPTLCTVLLTPIEPVKPALRHVADSKRAMEPPTRDKADDNEHKAPGTYVIVTNLDALNVNLLNPHAM